MPDTYQSMITREKHRPRLAPTVFTSPDLIISRLVHGGKFEMQTPGMDKHFLCVPYVGGTQLIYRQPKLLQEGVLSTGQITWHSAGQAAHWTVEAPPHINTVNIAISPALLAEQTGSKAVDFPPTRWFYDTQIGYLAAMMAEEVDSGLNGGTLFLESLSRSLAVRLTSCYGGVRVTNSPHKSGRVEVRKVKEVLQDNLSARHTESSLAALTNLSTTHLARIFRQETGESISQFLRRIRVQRASELLTGSEKSLAEIAQQVGFCDQSHLTRHFRQIMGVTPHAFRVRQ